MNPLATLCFPETIFANMKHILVPDTQTQTHTLFTDALQVTCRSRIYITQISVEV